MKRIARLVLLLVAVALVAVGCSGSGDPETFNEETRDNFIEACEEANQGDSATVSADTATFCECTYDEIEANMTFEDFKSVDDELDENAGDSILEIADLPKPQANAYLAAIATCNGGSGE